MLYFFRGKIIQNKTFLPIKKLNEYILNFNKKRKIIIKHNKKHIFFLKNEKYFKNDCIKYKFLEQTNIYKKISKLKHKKPFIYTEWQLYKFDKIIKTISKNTQEKINYNNEKYRSINNLCLIETIASSFANSVLITDNFNMFASFKKLTEFFKVYKKEAKILGTLVIKDLIEIYFRLSMDLYNLKKQILRAGNKKHFKIEKMNHTEIYGLYLFNPNASKFLNKLQTTTIIKATSSVINRIDENFYKQKIIFKYIQLLLVK